MGELWRRFLGVLCELGGAGDNLVAFALAEARRLPELALGLRVLGSLVHRFGLFYGLYAGARLVDWPQGHGQVLQVRLGVRPLFAELEVVERGPAANAWLRRDGRPVHFGPLALDLLRRLEVPHVVGGVGRGRVPIGPSALRIGSIDVESWEHVALLGRVSFLGDLRSELLELGLEAGVGQLPLPDLHLQAVDLGRALLVRIHLHLIIPVSWPRGGRVGATAALEQLVLVDLEFSHG